MQAFEKSWVRWGFAALLTLLSALANIVLQPALGGRAPMLSFFPALIAIGFFSGVWPAISSLAVSVLVMGTWWVRPLGTPWRIADVTDAWLIVAFLISGSLTIVATFTARGWLEGYRRTRRRLNLALTVGRMTTWEWDVATGRISLAPGAEAVFGARLGQIDTAMAAVHEDDRPRVVEHMRSALADATSQYSVLCRFVRPDTGEARWIETHGHVLRNAQGQALRVTGVAIDVDDRQRALDASRAAEERFEIALRGSGIAVWECDADMRYTWVRNPNLGIAPADFLGHRMGELIPRDQSLAYHDAAERVFASGRGETVEVRVDRPGEPVRHYLSTIDAKRDSHGRICGLIGVSMDITETKQAQEALQREAQRKDNFLATLAHELRNPMAPIRYAVAMLGDDMPPATRAHARDVLERQAGHMSRLLDDLLDMSRITRNAIELQRERVDLRSIVDQALETTRTTIAERRHRLMVDVPGEPVWVDGDPTRLLQVLGNLLDNASKYTAPGGEIRLVLRREGEQARLSVRDTGVGLAPDMLATVFDLFSRVPHRDRHDPGGLGIGLAVVRQLVELHGGRVQAESRGVGLGATFTVHLPLDLHAVDAMAATVVAPSMDVQPAHGDHILVVDDNVDAADMLAMALRLDGYDVSVAYDGESALEAQQAQHPVAVLLDIGLPDMSGHDVARRMCETPGARPKLIAISGWGQARDRELAQQAGFDAHLMKPVEPSQVRDTLRALLDGHGDVPGRPPSGVVGTIGHQRRDAAAG